MWTLDTPDLGPLTPAEQLWVIAQEVEEFDGPPAYVAALRASQVGWRTCPGGFRSRTTLAQQVRWGPKFAGLKS